MDEDKKIDFKKIKTILGYISLIINIFFICISLYLLNSQKKFVKILKYNLFTLIILDSISFIIFENHPYIFNQIYGDILFACLSSIGFYTFLSFIYQIYNNTKISILAKKIELIEPFKLTFLFLFIIFSYHKYTKLYKTLNIIENIIILCFITVLYRYLGNITKSIRNNLLPRDIKSAKIFYCLKLLNSICFLLIVIYYALKIVIMYTPQIPKIYMNIALNTVYFTLKYSIFYIFAVIIYILKKDRNKYIYEEDNKIIFGQVID